MMFEVLRLNIVLSWTVVIVFKIISIPAFQDPPAHSKSNSENTLYFNSALLKIRLSAFQMLSSYKKYFVFRIYCQSWFELA